MSSTNKFSELNVILERVYGTNLFGQPNFRIVFSDDMTEKRFGVYREYYGKIFLREFTGIREVPKYSYLKGVNLLERWIPPDLAYTSEIPETAQGSYEPLFAFTGEDGSALPVVEEQVHRIIKAIFNIPLPGHRKSLDETAEEKTFDKEVETNKLELEEAGRTWIGHRLHSGEAIIKP